MRNCFFAIAALVVATLPSSSPASAQAEGPWCAIVFNGEGSVREICHFRTIQECIAEVVSGNRGTCGNNPRYVGHVAGERPVARVAKRKHRHRQ